jgi:multidrug efflux pump subunit AcrA (membrane-fusion protein)
MTVVDLRSTLHLLLVTLLVPWLAACAGAGADPAAAARDGLVVQRGDFTETVLLTGELKAEEAVELTVPKSPTWRVQLKWLADDGAEVAPGDPLVEFDASSFTSDLEEKRLQLAEKHNELEKSRAESDVQESERLFAIEQAEAELVKARSRADVPPELLSEREYQDRQLAAKTAEIALAKAREELGSTRAQKRTDLEMKRLEIETAQREIGVAESALEAMRLEAPEEGIFVVGEHPWEGRKLQEGDTVWVGITVGRLPDLSTMQVQALLSDVDDGRVAVGMEGRCTLDAYLDREFACRVTSVSPLARETNRVSLLRFFDVGLELVESDPSIMLPGMSVKVEIAAAEQRDALLAPRAALDETAEPPLARLAGGGTAEVELGPCNTMHCVVESGLEEGVRLAPFASTGGAEAAG